jgi:hypothetical protein
MKPMPQITAAQGSRWRDRASHRHMPYCPATDCNFYSVGQRHADDANSRRNSRSSSERRSFRDIGREYWKKETPTSFFAELFFFAVIVLISAWPLPALVEALASLP